MLERGGTQTLSAVTSWPLNIHSQSGGGGETLLGTYGKLPPLLYQGLKRGKMKLSLLSSGTGEKREGSLLSLPMAPATTDSISAVGFWESTPLIIARTGGGFEEDEAMRRGEKIGKPGKFLHSLLF
jgi:hypothetical protein